MNKRQKLQVALAICFAVLFLVWIFLPTSVYSRILGLISNALGFLSMVLSYRSEEKNKKRTEWTEFQFIGLLSYSGCLSRHPLLEPLYAPIISAIGNVVDFMVGTSELDFILRFLAMAESKQASFCSFGLPKMFVGIEPAQGACQPDKPFCLLSLLQNLVFRSLIRTFELRSKVLDEPSEHSSWSSRSEILKEFWPTVLFCHDSA